MIQNIHTTYSDISLEGDRRSFTITADPSDDLLTSLKADLLYYNRVDDGGYKLSTLVGISLAKPSSSKYEITYNPSNLWNNSAQEKEVDIQAAENYSFINSISSDGTPLVYSPSFKGYDSDFNINDTLSPVIGNVVLTDGWYTLVQIDIAFTDMLSVEGVFGGNGSGSVLYIYDSGWKRFTTINLDYEHGFGYYLEGNNVYPDGSVGIQDALIIPASKYIIDNAYDTFSKDAYRNFRDRIEWAAYQADKGNFFEAQRVVQSVNNMLITA